MEEEERDRKIKKKKKKKIFRPESSVLSLACSSTQTFIKISLG